MSRLTIEGLENLIKPTVEALSKTEAPTLGKAVAKAAEHETGGIAGALDEATKIAGSEVHPSTLDAPVSSIDNSLTESALKDASGVDNQAEHLATTETPSPVAAEEAAVADAAVPPEVPPSGGEVGTGGGLPDEPSGFGGGGSEGPPPTNPTSFFARNGVDVNWLVDQSVEMIHNGSTFEEATGEVWQNIAKRHLTEDAETLVEGYSNFMKDVWNKARGSFPDGVKPTKVTMEAVTAFRNLAEANGVGNIDAALDMSKKLATNAEDWDWQIKSVQRAVVDLTDTLGGMARKVADGGSSLDRVEMLYWLDKYGDLMANFLTTNAGLGRSLRILGVDVAPEAVGRNRKAISEGITKVTGVKDFFERSGLSDAFKQASRRGADVSEVLRTAIADGRINIDDINELLQANGGTRKIDTMSRIVAAVGDDPYKLRKALNSNLLVDIINELHVNALLSSPPSALVDVVSTAAKTFLLPGEKILGGVLTLNLNQINEGIAMYSALSNSYKEAFNFTTAALRSGKPILDTAFGAMEHYAPSITSTRLGVGTGGFADAIDYIGNAVRLPSRLRMGSDEFFKQLNYRAMAMLELTKAGQKQGLGADALAGFVRDGMSALTSPEVLASKSQTIRDIYQKALDYAREATFQRPLDGILADGASLLNRHPVFKLLIPFVRTPVNLVRDVVIRSSPPLEMLRKEFWKDVTEGGVAKRTDAVGRLATGAMLWGSAIALAVEGKITGGGPQSKGEMAIKRGDGWQPYSIVISNSDGTKTYIKYSRLDPFSTFLGLAADYTEVANNVDNNTRSELASSMLMTTAHHLTSKTYLMTLGQILEAITNPTTNSGSKFIGNFASSFAPAFFSSIPIDEYNRETRGVMDAVLAKVPGLSSTLPAKYDALGDPIKNINALGMNFINPFTITQSTNDPVRNELGRLSPNIGTVSASEMGEDLRNYTKPDGLSAYEHMNDQIRNMRLNGQTMKETLADLFNSDGYKSLPEVDDTTTQEDGRMALIRRVVGHYRSAARDETHREFPELAAKLKQIAQERARLVTPTMIAGRKYSDLYPAN